MPSRLLFIVEAMLLLMAGENLVTLLRTGDMHTMPRPLAEHTGGSGRLHDVRHTALMPSPSSKRASNLGRSSVTELHFHGVNTSGQMATSFTHVSDTKRHLCLRSLTMT